MKPLMQAATANMLDGIDPLSHYVPPAPMAEQTILLFQKSPGQSDLSTIAIPAGMYSQNINLLASPVAPVLIGHILYLRVSAFPADAVPAIQDCLTQAGGGLRGLILDLRYNHGGLLDESAAAAGLFLQNGAPIATVTARQPGNDETFAATSDDITHGLPMVVLVNGQTAEGGEMFAAALHDHHRATLIGSTTAGAGYVRTVIPLLDGGRAVLTSGQIILPSGQALQSRGIIPDIVIQQLGAAPSVFGTPPAGAPVNDDAAQGDYAVQQAVKILTRQ